MTASDIMNSKDFKKCEAFHSHVCPGLSIGFQAARTALDRLREGRAEDEEMVAVAETDACSTDAIQVLTGFTFGNGNFIYKDHGKIVLTFFSRNTCKGIRVDLKPDAFRPDEEHMSLIQKMIAGDAAEQEQQRFQQIHFERSYDILETPAEELFKITDVEMDLPPKARIEPSRP